jgi:hypothetical protein
MSSLPLPKGGGETWEWGCFVTLWHKTRPSHIYRWLTESHPTPWRLVSGGLSVSIKTIPWLLFWHFPTRTGLHKSVFCPWPWFFSPQLPVSGVCTYKPQGDERVLYTKPLNPPWRSHTGLSSDQRETSRQADVPGPLWGQGQPRKQTRTVPTPSLVHIPQNWTHFS